MIMILSKLKKLTLSSKFQLFKKPSVQRWLLLVFLSLSIAAFLSPTLEEIVPTYRVGDIALKDIRTDRDLLVLDTAATDKKREEAAKKALPVYDYSPFLLVEIESVLDGVFSVLKERGAEEVQKKQVENILGTSFSTQEFKVLKAHRYDEKIRMILLEIVTPLAKQGIVGNKKDLLQYHEEGIIVRNIQTGQEVIKRDLGSLVDYQEVIDTIAKNVTEFKAKDIPPELRGVMVKMASAIIKPNLTINWEETKKRKDIERKQVKPVYFPIEKGELLLRKGQRVTEEDVGKLEALREMRRTGPTLLMMAGYFFLSSLFLLAFYVFATSNIRKVSFNNKDLLFLSMVLVSSLGLVRISNIIVDGLASAIPQIPLSSYYYLLPIAASAMLIRIVLNSEVALIFSIFVSFLVGLLLREGIFFSLFYIIGSIVAAHCVARCDQRSRLIKGGVIVGIVNVLLVIFQGMITTTLLEPEVLFGSLMGLVGGVIAGIIVVGITPVIESIFGYTTDIKLLELANLDQPLLKEMLVKAPGTYHHSMIVGSLVEAAAKAIKVNPLLARVSAYYHDIGKIKKPQYFIENQKDGVNKHDKLTPNMSSLILVSHVKEGVELAKEHKLGNKIVDIIKQHHGTRLINYFYQKAKELSNQGGHEVDEREFRYLGPKPQTKEAGLVMLADAVEAASRTLDDPTPARIQGLVQRIINDIFIDGQLDECELTLKDLNAIARSFNIILNAIYHHRIEYPEQDISKQKNGSNSTRSAETETGKTAQRKKNGRKDIRRLGVLRQ